MAETTYDVVVIGGGMTGAGVAVDAASRGLKVALVERGDIASGTSSKSSKMVHGGLRYLQQKEFRLVYENLRERQRLLENAPYLVRPLPFLIPLFARNAAMAKALTKGYGGALRLYDLSGGWRIGQRHRRVSVDEALAHLPSLNREHLVAGFIYLDARGDDARVALTLVRTALDLGADVLNYAHVESVEHGETGHSMSVHVRDALDGSTFAVHARTVVNATGVWADEVFALAEHQPSYRVTPAKGVHLSVPRHRLAADVAAVLSVPHDRRSIFVVPFDDAPYTLIGTTDTPYDGPLDEPECTPRDVEYLLSAINSSTSSNLSPADVTGVWAGLRPLLAPRDGEQLTERTSDLSRRHRVSDSHDGVIHITGGKWTTYRQMAEDTVDALRPYLPGLAKVRTKHMALHGVGDWRPSSELERHLFARYGEDAADVVALVAEYPHLGDPMIAGQPYVGAEFVHAVRHEMALTLEDLLTRRTRAHLHDARTTAAAATDIAQLVAPELGWDDDETARQIETYLSLVRREFSAAGLSL